MQPIINPRGVHPLAASVMMDMMASRELDLVDWLTRRAAADPRVPLGIGDDMAVIESGTGTVLLAADMLLDGVHFDARTQPLELIGRKALACSLSDCAAMAVEPLAATVSLAMPASFDLAAARRLYQGVFDLAAEFSVSIVGGDTTAWTNPLAIDVAILARPYAGVAPVRRSGARPGDTLYVTGPLGGSLLGRHLAFTPRVREARQLAATLGPRLRAMMDISDGLSLDLHRMCRASGTGALLDAALLEAVISGDARRAAAEDRRPPLDHALADGEDFELLLAVEGDAAGCPVPLLPIGTVTEPPAVRLRHPDGRLADLPAAGYEHE